jgi:ABC-2 type transport system ATP-binding protein
MSTPALLTKNLSKSFGEKEVVRDISFQIEPGEIFGLLGPNGAGKSTTINMIGGVCHVGGGKIEIFGKNVVGDFITTRRLTGIMHQEVVVDTFFNIEQALSLHEGYYGAPRDPKWRATLVEALALGPFLKMRPNQLSGGTKRRFMVAKALVHKPRLLILDEPTAGVDVELRHSLWEFVRGVNRQGTTILLTTHYLQEAEEMCGRIAIMNKGKIIALEKKAALLGLIEGKKLKVTLSNPLTQIPQELLAIGASSNDSGKTLEFKVAGSLSIDRILESLRAAKLSILDLESSSASLEDVFLKLTQEDSR